MRPSVVAGWRVAIAAASCSLLYRTPMFALTTPQRFDGGGVLQARPWAVRRAMR